MKRVLVYGLAVAGEATARALLQRGIDVVAVDDVATPERVALAADLGIEFDVAPEGGALDRLIATVDAVVPAPGVPETHRLFAAAAAGGRPVLSEIELAYRWEQERPGGPRPIITVTGTDGKTTTTMLAVAMLEAAGLSTVAAGNTDTPLVAALDLLVDAFVVECTSFRLAWAETFRGDAAAWINLAPDHLNWHRSMDTYTEAKARLFLNQRPDDVAIGYAADETVAAWLAKAPARHVTFGTPEADYRVEDGSLVSPFGELAPVSVLSRPLPHDVRNGLAAAALVLESGLVGREAVASALATFVGPPHRIELVGEREGVRYFNDSKATTPHAAATAIAGFDHVVLIAGGRNKGLDLRGMAAERHRIRAVVAIGEAADTIAALFEGAPVHRAADMAQAVDVAGAAASPGDVVLLSPGCASFDWYRNYEERGDHFRALVRVATGLAPEDLS